MMPGVPQQPMWPMGFNAPYGGAPAGGPPAAGGGAIGGNFNPNSQMNQFTDPNNTTVFVGGLSGYVTEDELRSFFQGFGEITYVKIPPGKGCGFVQFVHRHAAEMAINQMQGYPIGNSRVRSTLEDPLKDRGDHQAHPFPKDHHPAPFSSNLARRVHKAQLRKAVVDCSWPAGFARPSVEKPS
jgi:RNA recognition motif-containing protein